MEQVRLFFDPTRFAPDPAAKASVLAKATEYALELRRSPARFAELSQLSCCEYPETWVDGRGSPPLTNALSRLQPGEIASEPIQSEYSYVIPKRIEPPPSQPIVASYELPEPRVPDIQAVVGARDNAFLRTHLQSIGDEVLAADIWPKEVASRLATLHRSDQRFPAAGSPEVRLEAFRALLEEVKSLTGPSTYPRYVDLVNAHFERLLRPPQ
jgi:hypothetical protein